ncbi:hypothetical protein RMT89_42460, partial [Streptomyces sp. P17]
IDPGLAQRPAIPAFRKEAARITMTCWRQDKDAGKGGGLDLHDSLRLRTFGGCLYATAGLVSLLMKKSELLPVSWTAS